MTKASKPVDSKVAEAYDQAAQALLAAAGQQDEGALGHSERVTNFCLTVGKHLGMNQTDLTNLRYAASLHDIGKIGISRSIVNKLGSLTDEEFEIMRLHSTLGIRILEKVEGLRGALPLIKHHHERWDGQGYPDKLAGDDIPLGARIIAVAETYDILTSKVHWRRPMTVKHAATELRRCSGSQFDPKVVEAMIEAVIAEKAKDEEKAQSLAA